MSCSCGGGGVGVSGIDGIGRQCCEFPQWCTMSLLMVAGFEISHMNVGKVSKCPFVCLVELLRVSLARSTKDRVYASQR